MCTCEVRTDAYSYLSLRFSHTHSKAAAFKACMAQRSLPKTWRQREKVHWCLVLIWIIFTARTCVCECVLSLVRGECQSSKINTQHEKGSRSWISGRTERSPGPCGAPGWTLAGGLAQGPERLTVCLDASADRPACWHISQSAWLKSGRWFAWTLDAVSYYLLTRHKQHCTGPLVAKQQSFSVLEQELPGFIQREKVLSCFSWTAAVRVTLCWIRTEPPSALPRGCP